MPPRKPFVPRQRKHKVLARQRQAQASVGDATKEQNPNELEILPEEVRARNAEKERLRAELRAGQASQMSAKKSKRFEKYLETKLRKDENRALNEKLGAARQILEGEDGTGALVFESSKDLGKGKRRRRAEQQKQRSLATGASDVEDEEEEDDDDDKPEKIILRQRDQRTTRVEKAKPAAAIVASAELAATAEMTRVANTGSPTLQVTAGSGLKRPLELGEDGKPVIQKRQKRGGVKSKFFTETVESVKIQTYEEWNGFSEEEGEEEGDDDDNDDDGVSEEDSSEEDSSEDDASDRRASGFKLWAQQQRNEALGFQSTTGVLTVPRPANFTPRAVENEPLPVELRSTPVKERKMFHVDVLRTPAVEAARMALPIVAEEHQIMEAVHASDVVVVAGGTGSGKTTQVPQFLYEAGYGVAGSPTPGMIGVTQPRRVAAVSMARRVAEELGEVGGRALVGYQIRFEGTVRAETAIKFMTDGVLLREMTGGDMLLRRYSAVIVDEAHERSINTDLLIGLLSRVNRMRALTDASLPSLKIIIMSATLQMADFAENPRLFPTQSVENGEVGEAREAEPVPAVRTVAVEGRQHPVAIHFARVTHWDYVEEAFRKIVRGHRQLPPGGFLVFLTGEVEIQQLAKRLRQEINGADTAGAAPSVVLSATDVPLEEEDVDFAATVEQRRGIVEEVESGEAEDGEDEDEDAEFVADEGEQLGSGPRRAHILPLYGKLPTQEQQRVFGPVPTGTRRIVLATNVAETSLTLPDIRYVFDAGRAKERRHNAATGVQSFDVVWISKAGAAQRAGRAGRTGPGHCYRLYSSAVFEEFFPDFPTPAILRAPVDGVVLQLRSLLPRGLTLQQFPFPTAPDAARLTQAERVLVHLGALTLGDGVTELGRLMASFPLSPRFAKMLLVGYVDGCLPYMVLLVAALSSADDLFVRETKAADKETTTKEATTKKEVTNKEATNRRHFCALDPLADALVLVQAVGEFLAVRAHEDDPRPWCQAHGIRFETLVEVCQMAAQLRVLLRTHVPAVRAQVPAAADGRPLPPPTPAQVAQLKVLAASGFVENLAIRADQHPQLPADLHRQWTLNPRLARPSRAADVPYVPLLPVSDNADEDTAPGGHAFVFLRPASPMARVAPSECPPYVCYTHLVRSRPRSAVSFDKDSAATPRTPRIRMQPLTDVPRNRLRSLLAGSPLLHYGKPIKIVAEAPDRVERQVWVVPYVQPTSATGGHGWPLPACRIWQRNVPGHGWQVLDNDE